MLKLVNNPMMMQISRATRSSAETSDDKLRKYTGARNGIRPIILFMNTLPYSCSKKREIDLSRHIRHTHMLTTGTWVPMAYFKDIGNL